MIHVSGHPGRPELEALYDWLNPEILVPVHGEIRHMQEQARVGLEAGIPSAVFQKNGDIVRLAPGKPGKIAEIEAGRLVLDGDIIVPADGESIVMRRRLAHNGVLVVMLEKGGDVTIESIGLPLDEDHDDFIAEATADVAKAVSSTGKTRGGGRGRKSSSPSDDRLEAARLAARRAATRWSGKKPQVRVVDLAG